DIFLASILEHLDKVISILLTRGNELHLDPRSKLSVADAALDSELPRARVRRRSGRIAWALLALGNDMDVDVLLGMRKPQKMPTVRRASTDREAVARRHRGDLFELVSGNDDVDVERRHLGAMPDGRQATGDRDRRIDLLRNALKSLDALREAIHLSSRHSSYARSSVVELHGRRKRRNVRLQARS